VIFETTSRGVRTDGSIEVDVRIKARTGFVSGTISADDVVMQGADGSLLSASLVSTTAVSDGYTRARFQFIPVGSAFDAGVYTNRTVQGGIVGLNGFASTVGRVTLYTIGGSCN